MHSNVVFSTSQASQWLNVPASRRASQHVMCQSAAAPAQLTKPASPAPLKVSMVSLGCPKNTVDGEACSRPQATPLPCLPSPPPLHVAVGCLSCTPPGPAARAGEVLLGDLYRSGFEITDAHEDADAIVINTCGFVEDAKAESIETIVEAARLKGEGRVKKVVVTGCLAQRYSEELAEQLPEADLVVGFERYGGLSAALRSMLGAPLEVDDEEYARRGRVQVRQASSCWWWGHHFCASLRYADHWARGGVAAVAPCGVQIGCMIAARSRLE